MAIDFRKMTILVVTDVIPLKKQVVSIFESLSTGAILTAAHARSGYDLFCTRRPNLVIADMDMAAMGGLELTREIRHKSRSPNCRAPVILLSARITEKQVADARIAGVSALVLRPFSRKDLLDHVARVMTDSRDFIEGPTYSGPNRRQEEDPGH